MPSKCSSIWGEGIPGVHVDGDEHGIPIDHPDTNELFTALADVVATSGLVFVLPGRTPTQAVVMTVEGRDEGHGVGAPEWTSTGTPPLDG